MFVSFNGFNKKGYNFIISGHVWPMVIAKTLTGWCSPTPTSNRLGDQPSKVGNTGRKSCEGTVVLGNIYFPVFVGAKHWWNWVGPNLFTHQWSYFEWFNINEPWTWVVSGCLVSFNIGCLDDVHNLIAMMRLMPMSLDLYRHVNAAKCRCRMGTKKHRVTIYTNKLMITAPEK